MSLHAIVCTPTIPALFILLDIYTGLILSANDIGYLIAVMVGSYVGKQLHIPRALSVSAIIFGLSSVSMALGKLTEVKAGLSIGQNASGLGTEEDSQQQYMCSATGFSDGEFFFAANVTTLEDTPSNDSDPGGSSPALPWAFWLMALCSVVGGIVKSYRVPLLTHYVESNVKDNSSSALLLGQYGSGPSRFKGSMTVIE
ncbi:solute carrier organic anion transporter family member [Elysia marginata]|uniref:Solute carrier organic anion transporter family member n=1 Tax=Elysia marginata TaxID=1093978 RepID=A0AAV4IMX2_9GAST|nr:solute carrier organic anion transporter family member [Elysia marginata]